MADYNPFNPNSVVVPNLFAGRTQRVNNICKKLSQLQHNMPASFFIYGERGIGKTALAKLVKYISSENDPDLHSLKLLTSYYSVEENQSIGSILQESINKLTEEMNQPMLSRISERVGGLFKNGKFQIGAFGATFSTQLDEAARKQKEITIKDQTVSILANIIRTLTEDKENEKDGVLIVIDEVHNLQDLPSLASIIRNIVTSLDVENMGKISFLLIGYEEDVVEFFSRDSSARRTFDIFELDVMPDGEAEDVFKKGFEVANVTWDENALKENIEVAGGYPHSLQIIGHNLIDVDTDNHIDESDWGKATTKSAFELRKKEFSSMYKFDKPLTHSDRILAVLAEENRPMAKKELSEKSGIKNVYQHFKSLKTNGAIKENDDAEIFLHSQLFRTVILLDQFLRRSRAGRGKKTID